jgi:hypothetical protein
MKSRLYIKRDTKSECTSSNSSLVEPLKISTPEKQPIECYDQKCVRKKCWCKGQSGWGGIKGQFLGDKLVMKSRLYIKRDAEILHTAPSHMGEYVCQISEQEIEHNQIWLGKSSKTKIG